MLIPLERLTSILLMTLVHKIMLIFSVDLTSHRNTSLPLQDPHSMIALNLHWILTTFFIAFFNAGNSSWRTIQEFHRTMTNVGEAQTVYVANITPIKGFHVSVIPKKLEFREKNEKLSFKLRIEVGRMTRLKKVDFGYLTWMDVSHVVRSPVVVTTLKFKS
jgi:hypothetical protein